jgi:hypothetical protein
MAITIKEHHGAIDSAAIADRLNDLLDAISDARASHDAKRFEYCSGVYDGYREALAAMGCTVIYDSTIRITGIEAR